MNSAPQFNTKGHLDILWELCFNKKYYFQNTL